MPDILHKIKINAPYDKVYQALTEQKGLAGWWTKEVRAEPKARTNAQFWFHNRSVTLIMEIPELEKDQRVSWICTGGPPQWKETEITFGLEPVSGATVVRFSHRGWQEAGDYFRHSCTKWAYYLLSLKKFVETGKGTPHPDDLDL